MPVYQTAYYQVKPDAVAKCKQAIVEFVDYIKNNEPGTEMYLAWQKEDDPTCFVHLFKFKDAKSKMIHANSDAVLKFESIYRPALLSKGVKFTNYLMVAGKI